MLSHKGSSVGRLVSFQLFILCFHCTNKLILMKYAEHEQMLGPFG